MAKALNALLPVARWAVISLAVGTLLTSIIGLFLFPQYAGRHLDAFVPHAWWTGAEVQQALAELGWPAMAAAWFEGARDLVSVLLVYSITALILWKKSQDWFGLMLMVVFVIMGPIGGSLNLPIIEKLPGLSGFYDFTGAIGWQLFFLIFIFFPNGRPVPSWAAWFAAGYAAFMLVAVSNAQLNNSLVSTFLGTFMVMLAIGSQVYRYLRRSNAVQRQQTRWVVSVLGLFLVILPVGFLVGFQAPPADQLGPALIKDYALNIVFSMIFWLTPAAIAIAVLRYHLWDLDILIRRTLLYALLSGMLGLVYFGSVVLLQQFFRAISGQNSPVAVVISTLAIAALFTPLRRGLQTVIDRRFFRRKYDAQNAIERFSQSLRGHVNLQAVEDELVETVSATIQPTSVTIWLRQAEGRKDHAR